MKNIIIIDIDTEREQPVLIGKGKETPPPSTVEEATKMLFEDIACTTDALISMVHIVDQNKYGTKEDLIEKIKIQLNSYLTNEK